MGGRVKIIHIISDTNIGGAGVYLKTLAGHFDRDRFDIEIILPSESRLAPELAPYSVNLTEFARMADKSFDIRSVFGFRRLFKEQKPDVIHTHAAMSARIAGRFASRRTKIIYTRHTVSEPPEKMTVFPLKQLNGAVNNYFCDRIIAVSPAAKDNLVSTGVNEKKIEVIFNGTERQKQITEAEKSELRKKYGIGRDKFVAAQIGRFSPEKGHALALTAAGICKKDKDIVFVFAGTGPLEEELKKKADALKLDNIIMTGFVKNIWEIENIMDLQVNASLAEATSLSLLEGMSLKKPAAASDCGGNPFVIEHGVNGLIFPKKDANALAEAILKIKSDGELYKNLSAGAEKIYSERFTAERMVSRVCQLYEEVLRG